MRQIVFFVRESLHQFFGIGGCCRFQPTCSQYAAEAFENRGFLSALFLVFWRIIRCRPGGSFGYDPVPKT